MSVDIVVTNYLGVQTTYHTASGLRGRVLGPKTSLEGLLDDPG